MIGTDMRFRRATSRDRGEIHQLSRVPEVYEYLADSVEPPPDIASAWVDNTFTCGSILRLEVGQVRGFVEGPRRTRQAAREADPAMSLPELVRRIAEIHEDESP